MSKPLHVLIVEDLEDDAILLVRELSKHGYDVNFQRVDTPEAMSAALSQSAWDVVLADYVMPKFSAPAALMMLKDRELEIPFIIVSGAIGEETAVKAMKAGAHDYVMKDNPSRLVPAIERELREAKERRRHQQASKALIEREKQYRSLFENASDGILIRHLDGNIVMANKAMANLTGYTVEELAKMNISKFLTPQSFEIAMKRQKHLTENRKTAGQRYELDMIRKDGTQRVTESVASLVADEGHSTTIQVIIRDVTERRKAQENMHVYVNQITKAQEEERQRIARDIHDDTIQALARMGLDIDSLLNSEEQLSDGVMQSLQELRIKTTELLQGTRRLTRDLRPPMLDEMGLVDALQWSVDKLKEQHSINVTLKVQGALRRLLPETELVLFRIVQEALTNVRKHSHATEVMIQADFNPEKVKLSIADNGCGFELPEAIDGLARTGQLGLIGMRERARLLNGTLEVESELNKGTTITLEMYECE